MGPQTCFTEGIYDTVTVQGGVECVGFYANTIKGDNKGSSAHAPIAPAPMGHLLQHISIFFSISFVGKISWINKQIIVQEVLSIGSGPQVSVATTSLSGP